MSDNRRSDLVGARQSGRGERFGLGPKSSRSTLSGIPSLRPARLTRWCDRDRLLSRQFEPAPELESNLPHQVYRATNHKQLVLQIQCPGQRSIARSLDFGHLVRYQRYHNLWRQGPSRGGASQDDLSRLLRQERQYLGHVLVLQRPNRRAEGSIQLVQKRRSALAPSGLCATSKRIDGSLWQLDEFQPAWPAKIRCSLGQSIRSEFEEIRRSARVSLARTARAKIRSLIATQ